MWRNWQTRMVQVHVKAISWGFKSLHPHQSPCRKTRAFFLFFKFFPAILIVSATKGGSSMQHRLSYGKLLNEKGHLSEAGYSTSLVREYCRADIKAPALRIKEWDYYLIYNDRIAIALTMDDNAYMSMLSASFIDLTVPCEITVSPMGILPMGKVGLPSSSAAGISHLKLADKKNPAEFTFSTENGVRKLQCKMENFHNGHSFVCDIVLTEEPRDSMVIATPFDGAPKAFYYNQKIVGMRASGSVSVDGKLYTLEPGETFGLLDWGRGVWTYENTWYWGAGHGMADGRVVGFNIGYGFGNTSAASENMIFVDGIAHKLDRVTFNIPQTPDGKDDFLKPWTFTSSDGRFEMDFLPILDRASCTDVKLICSDQHQVFGKFTGKMVLDDGTVIHLKYFVGFEEKVHNKW